MHNFPTKNYFYKKIFNDYDYPIHILVICVFIIVLFKYCNKILIITITVIYSNVILLYCFPELYYDYLFLGVLYN